MTYSNEPFVSHNEQYQNSGVIGICKHCGGDVIIPTQWDNSNTPPTCTKCGRYLNKIKTQNVYK